MEFSWEWDRGPIGATTTGGAATAFAGRAEGAITRTPVTMGDGPREAATRRITARRAIIDHGIMAAGRMVTADLFITTTGRRVTVADPPTTEGAAGLPMVAGLDRQAVAMAVVSPRVEVANLRTATDTRGLL
jgi:hypothetical protein